MSIKYFFFFFFWQVTLFFVYLRVNYLLAPNQPAPENRDFNIQRRDGNENVA